MLPYDELFIENSPQSRRTAKRRILRDKLINYICDICNSGPSWNDKVLVLRLDHINGVNNDHRLCNLRFVCPNCDSQLPTYGGRNVKWQIKIRECSYCKATISRWSKTGKCKICARSKSNKPSSAELQELLAKMSMVQIGKLLGVSDKTISKWCKKLPNQDSNLD